MAAAALLTAAAVSGVLNRADQTAADAWYQKPSASEGNIVLVGIDQKALEDIGPFQNWGRDTMAMVIEALNESEDCHPAVIAVDAYDKKKGESYLHIGPPKTKTSARTIPVPSLLMNIIKKFYRITLTTTS